MARIVKNNSPKKSVSPGQMSPNPMLHTTIAREEAY
jgi:hypothetical protein